MLDQLDEGWSVSARSRDDRLTHHTSLDDAIDWSFRLLDDGERELLLVLSAFRGPFDLAAAARIADHDLLTTADRLAQLVEKSLVQSAPGRAGRRCRLLETVRAFATIRVDPAIEAAMRDRHARYFADQVTTLGALVPGGGRRCVGPTRGRARRRARRARARGRERRRGDGGRARPDHASRSRRRVRDGRSSHGAVELPGIEDQPAYVALLATRRGRGPHGRPAARSQPRPGLHVEGDLAQHPRLCWILPQATGGSFVEGADCCMVGAEARAPTARLNPSCSQRPRSTAAPATSRPRSTRLGALPSRDRQPFVAGVPRALLRSTGHRCGDGAAQPKRSGDCRRG
jgi:hypothetical protein